MIGKLSGVIDSFGPDHLILDVNGVGYQVYASRRTLGMIGQRGDPASLLINTQVREDAITLLGFADASEQQWFKLLTSVQGVGAKVGFAILAVCTPDRLPVIIASQDKASLNQADGVGPKLAARILTELKDKTMSIEHGINPSSSREREGAQRQGEGYNLQNDLISALVNLGYGRTEAHTAAMSAKSKANDNEQSSLQTMIRLALKELSA